MEQPAPITLKDILAKIQEIDRVEAYRQAVIAGGGSAYDVSILTKRMQGLALEVSAAMQGTYPANDEDFATVQEAIKAIHQKLFGQ